MKVKLFFFSIIFAGLAALFACSQVDPGGSPVIPDPTPQAPDPTPVSPGTGVDLSITFSSSSGIPDFYAIGSGRNTDFCAIVTNNGRSIASGTEMLLIYILEANEPDLSVDDFLSDPEPNILAYDYVMDGFSEGQGMMFTFEDVDISSGAPGNNYFYVLVLANDKTFFIQDELPADNVETLNFDFPCEAVDLPHTPWWGVDDLPLNGGAGYSSPTVIPEPSLDIWYWSSMLAGEQMWYSLSVSTVDTYELYWSDLTEGSGFFFGDVDANICRLDGSTYFPFQTDKGYRTPLGITPEEDTILINIKCITSGEFAFGLLMY